MLWAVDVGLVHRVASLFMLQLSWCQFLVFRGDDDEAHRCEQLA